MYNIETVNAFVTEDGQLFPTHLLAAEHAKDLLRAKISYFLERQLADVQQMTVVEASSQIVAAVMKGVTTDWLPTPPATEE